MSDTAASTTGSRLQHVRLLSRVAVIWIPSSAVAFMFAFQAAATSHIVQDMGPGLHSGTLAGAMPWWALGLLLSAVLLILVTIATTVFRARPGVALFVSVVVAAGLLYIVLYLLVIAPITSAFTATQ